MELEVDGRQNVPKRHADHRSTSRSSLPLLALMLFLVLCGSAAEDTSEYPVQVGTPRRTFSPQDTLESHASVATSVTEANNRNPTNTNTMLEYADVDESPKLDDTNFKTLVRHCLRSENESACNGMQHWDTSRVKDMSWLFWEEPNTGTTTTSTTNNGGTSRSSSRDDWILTKGADTFNVDLSRWNTTSVTTMQSMFNGAVSFDQPIGDWQVARVTDMSHMYVPIGSITDCPCSSVNSPCVNFYYHGRFQGARKFNQDLSQWKTHNTLDMSHMFRFASHFQPSTSLSTWDTSRVTTMAYMFSSATHFPGKGIDKWKTTRVQQFEHMFHKAEAFNQYLGLWDVSGAVDEPELKTYGFVGMFDGAHKFNQDISHWDMQSATNLDTMFQDAFSFDQDLSAWQITQVTSMVDMFHQATFFSQTLCWDIRDKQTGTDPFDGTKDAWADHNLDHCWEVKQLVLNHDMIGESESKPFEAGTHVPQSLGMRFLQGLLFAVAAALAGYWLFLIKQYFKSRREKREILNKITERGRRDSTGTFHADGSSRNYTDHDGHQDGGSTSSSEEAEVEILFENTDHLDEMRRTMFSQSFALAMNENEDRNMMMMEHAIPAMATLLEQERLQREEEERRQEKLERERDEYFMTASQRQREYTPGSSARHTPRAGGPPKEARPMLDIEYASDVSEDMEDTSVTMSEAPTWHEKQQPQQHQRQPQHQKFDPMKGPLLDMIQVQVQYPFSSTTTVVPPMRDMEDQFQGMSPPTATKMASPPSMMSIEDIRHDINLALETANSQLTNNLAKQTSKKHKFRMPKFITKKRSKRNNAFAASTSSVGSISTGVAERPGISTDASWLDQGLDVTRTGDDLSGEKSIPQEGSAWV